MFLMDLVMAKLASPGLTHQCSTRVKVNHLEADCLVGILFT